MPTKRKDGLLQECVTVAGKKKYFYGRTKAELRQKILLYTERREAGELFGAVADAWWEEAEPLLAENTKKPYRPALSRAKEHFSSMRVCDITPRHIDSFLTDFSKDHAQKTVKTQLMIFSLIFRFAVRNGYCLTNPARELTVPQNLKKTKRPPCSDEDLLRIKQNVDEPFGLFLYMAIYTGMRKGELLALHWSDIDLDARTISVTKSIYHVSNVPFEKPPKTAESVGIVPILDALLPVLKKRKPKSKKDLLVFPSPSGGYLTETQYQRCYELYRQATGVTATAHQCRHSYATMLFEANVPPEKMQVLLRHAQLSTTMDIYKSLRKDKLKSIQEEVFSVDFT